MQIELDELKTTLQAGRTRVVEVLPQRYYDEGHLPGALQVTNAELASRAEALVGAKDAPVVVYCSGPTCQNSHRAAEELAALGYTAVRVFAGGKAAWREAGLPLVVGEQT